MRGFGNIDSASDIMNMYHIYFNYLRPNIALGGKSPAESAGLGNNDLVSMIERAYEWNKGRNDRN